MLPSHPLYYPAVKINAMFGSFKKEESRGKESSGEERSVEGSSYVPPCLNVFKIKREGNN